VRLMLAGDKRALRLEMIHDTSRLSSHFQQQDSSQSSSFAAYETASVRTAATITLNQSCTV